MRKFIADDGSGAELREEDVLKVRLRLWDSETHEAACRIDAALAPKTCRAKLLSARLGWTADQPTHVNGLACVLPPNHQGAHQVAPECWRES